MAATADLRARRGDQQGALELAERATAIAGETGHRLVEADALTTMAEARARLGDRARAAEDARAALAICTAAGHPAGIRRARRLVR